MTAERRLLRDISHELRSPLARLSVALGLARQRPTEDSAALDRIEREADRLNALIGQLLTLARLESGAREPAREIVEVLAIVREVAEDADFEARGRRRAVQIVEAADAWSSATGSCCAVRSRTWSATRSVTRRTAPRWRSSCAGCTSTAPRACGSPSAITAAASPSSALPFIFEPFYRVSEAREHGSGGVGLGLTIAHRTIRLHGGTVSAANALGRRSHRRHRPARADRDLAPGAPRRPRLTPEYAILPPPVPRRWHRHGDSAAGHDRAHSHRRLRASGRAHHRAGPAGREPGVVRTHEAGAADHRDHARDGAHPRAVHQRAVSPASRRRRGEVRQQRPLPAERAGRLAAAHDGPARAGLAADGPDRVVHADRSRSVEPAARQGARPLHAALRARGGQGSAEAADPLARSGAARPPRARSASA